MLAHPSPFSPPLLMVGTFPGQRAGMDGEREEENRGEGEGKRWGVGGGGAWKVIFFLSTCAACRSSAQPISRRELTMATLGDQSLHLETQSVLNNSV